jgi:hypothetical protein
MNTTTDALALSVPEAGEALATQEKPTLRVSAAGKALDVCPKKFKHWTDSGSPASRDGVRGTLVHSMMLGGADLVCIDFDSKSSKAARAAWKEAEDAGLTPCLRADFMEMAEAAAVGRALFEARFGLGSLERSVRERQLVAEVGGVILTGHPDAIVETEDEITVVEVKTTADISKFSEIIYNSHYDCQAAGYRELVAGTTTKYVSHTYLVLEKKEPYCGTWVTEDGYSEAIGEAKLADAVAIVAKAAMDGWPDYQPIEHSPKPHQLARWER